MVGEKVRFITIDESGDLQRVDNYLFKLLKGVPKSHIYQVIRKGNVRVNKKRVDASDKLRFGDELRVPPMRVPEKEVVILPHRQVDLIKKCILFEDANLMVINKPSGFPVHGGTAVSHGVIDLLRMAFPLYKFLELAHRLDRDTSGCLVIAKKSSILKELHDLFRSKDVEKIYLALCQGWWKPLTSRVDLPLIKNHLQSGERMVFVDKDGKDAVSTFITQEQFQDASLVEVHIETGRTHQIRVHASYSHHPLAGDEKYGDRRFNARLKQLGLDRLFLHAHRLSFKLRAYEEPLVINAPMPSDLLDVLKKLRN